MPRPDKLYIRDILEAADEIAENLEGVSRDEFLQSTALRRIAHCNLIIIGEASARLKEETKVAASAIPWRKAADLRNVMVHAYFGIDWEIIWHAATTEVPRLRREILAAFPDLDDVP